MNFGGDDIDAVIQGGITFKAGSKGDKKKNEDSKVKTKAKKKQYITGAHGSGSRIYEKKIVTTNTYTDGHMLGIRAGTECDDLQRQVQQQQRH